MDEKLNEKVITLREPVDMTVYAGNPDKTDKVVKLTELTVRKPKAKSLRNLPPGTFAEANGNENAMTIVLIALACDIPLETADELDINDVFDIAQTIYEMSPNLMSGFSGTGKRSSGESPQPSGSPQT